MSLFISKESKNALQKISKDTELRGYISKKLIFQLIFSILILLIGILLTLIDFTGFNFSFIFDLALYILIFGSYFIESIIEINILRKTKPIN